MMRLRKPALDMIKVQASRTRPLQLILVNRYHSYPDPNEKAKISSTKANHSKQLDKSTGIFDLNQKFRMDKPFPNAPVSKGISAGSRPKTLSTKLNNGLVVASEDIPGLMSSFSLIVRAGSSYEHQISSTANTGSAQFLEMNAFRSTKSRSHMELVTEIEKLGGMVQCISTRENILYCVDVLRENTEPALEVLADTVLNPSFPQEELEESRMIAQFQQEELPSEVFSRDLVQRAAYIGSSLGNYHFCPTDQLEKVDANSLYDFRDRFYFGENCVLAGAGIDHEYFVSLANKYFQNLPNKSATSITRPKSKYTGGMLKDQRVLKDPFIKIAMAFEVGGWKDEMLVPVCVLQQLLGGGSSFSAGGPGKGMYSRLYTQVLNRHYWAESIEAFVSIHEEHGLLGIDGACPPSSAVNLIKTIVDQFCTLATTPVNQEDLSRAKNMLKSMMMMQLESRLVLCEDIARQFTTFGAREDPKVVCDKIDAVTAQDLMKVANKILSQPPAIGCVGQDLSEIPDYESIKNFTKDTYMNILKRNMRW